MSDARAARRAAAEQWNRNPAGTTLVDAPDATPQFFAAMTAARYGRQPWLPALLDRFAPTGRLLEIGSGAGTDNSRLGAPVSVAVDLALRGARLTTGRMRLEARRGGAMVADGESLPLRDDAFDEVYSFGVIHHTDHPERVAAEMRRVMRPGARFMVALYHRRSLIAGIYALLWLRGRGSWSDHLARHIEDGADQLDDLPRVRLYSRRSARALFADFSDVNIEIDHLGLDERQAKRLPPPIRRLIARRWGWFVIVTGRA
jgi:SAM-dependent methyltransferase